MAKLGEKLGKLSLAILENFVGKTLGEKFVDELRAPTDRELALAAAVQNTEERFVGEFEDGDLSKALFVDLKQGDRPVLKEAVGAFYDHPTDPGFSKALQTILLGEFKQISPDRVGAAVKFYIEVLTEELALADDGFRENVRALADLRGERSQQEMVQILRRVKGLLEERETPKPETALFRSLHQLPQPPADFTGRKDLIDELLKDFNSHKGATITGKPIAGLTGMGGIGKTALGLVVAHEIAKLYPDAQIFLDLKGTIEPLSPLDIARHVILSFEPAADVRAMDQGNFAAAYQSVLHEKRALLFFDNARSADQIASLSPPGSCVMLVTSRWNFSVPGLQTRRVDLLSEGDAEAFLLELCPRIDEHAADLAKACGYLPLALRIAGSFLQVNNSFRLNDYVAQLNDRKSRLGTLQESRTAADLGAEPDLIASFELSYDQLNEDDRKRWQMLGVFPASFARSAAQAVWQVDENEARKVLGLLRRYSLVEYDENSNRYSLHDLLTDFALQHMDEGEGYEARLRHASHYKDVLSAADDLYLEGGEKILAGLLLFDTEWEHVRSGQVWAAETQPDRRSLELCIAYPDAGAYVLDLRQSPRDKIRWLELAATAAREIGDRRGEGNALGSLGNAYAVLGDARKAIEVHEQYRAIAREIGDRRGEGNALGNLGSAYADLGDARKAIGFYEQALVIDREIGDRGGEAFGSWNLGLQYEKAGELERAIEAMQLCVDFEREIGHPDAENDAAKVEEIRKKIK